tara:strand:- start:675 stop:1250 length:576 start_codon:yes stop_codon:yes gene_type:complete
LFKKINYILVFIFFYSSSLSHAQNNLQEKLLKKYKKIDTLSFNFTQKIGDKIEFGNCYIKYPLLMNCEYPKKKKNIITNGKKFAIVKRRYKKIYFYPLKKTPLYYLLNKENIINIITNFEPTLVDSRLIYYELIDSNKNIISIFFNKNSLELSGWKTLDAYSNEVSFLLKNIKTNVPIEDGIFKIPKEEDL